MLTFSLIVNLLMGMAIGWLYQDRVLLKRSAMRDALTGLKSGAFLRRFEREYEREIESPRGFWTFIYLDLDGFKEVNDTLGHSVGDNALQELARVLHEVFRAADFLIRLHGDEFLVIARRMEYEVAGRRLSELDRRLKEYGERLKVAMGVSGGIVRVERGDKLPLADVIAMSESLMREDKISRKAGR